MATVKQLLKNQVRIYVSDLTDVAKEAMRRHATLPLPSLILASAIAAFAPLGVMKKDGLVSAYIKSSGPIKNILVETNNHGDVRALVGNAKIVTEYDTKNFNLIPLILGIGETGTLRVVHAYNNENFGGEVNLVRSNIVSDLVHYFDQSEQVYTAVVVDVHLTTPRKLARAYSAIFQLLPNHTEEDINFVEKVVKSVSFSQVGWDGFINALEAKEVGTRTLQWKCSCSLAKAKEIVSAISQDEQAAIIAESGFIEVVCNFCNTKYRIKKVH